MDSSESIILTALTCGSTAVVILINIYVRSAMLLNYILHSNGRERPDNSDSHFSGIESMTRTAFENDRRGDMKEIATNKGVQVHQA